MTKRDEDNPEYTGKVLCSPGLGAGYVKRIGKRHEWKEEDTKEDYYIDEKADLTASFVVVSEGGHLLDEQFNTIEDAKKWVNETWDEDDQYLATFHEMTIAQQYALETMQDFDDIYPAADVLEAIKSGRFEKSEQEYYTMLCELDENHLGREYYAYFIANEFNLTRNPNFSSSDEDDYDYRKTISYKQFIMKRIAELSKYVAFEKAATESLAIEQFKSEFHENVEFVITSIVEC